MRLGLSRPPFARLLLLAAIPIAAAASPPPLPDDRLGVRTAPLLLLSRPDVCDDLGLDAEHRAEADRALTDLYLRAAALKGQTGGQALAGRKAIDEAQRAWFETHLTPAQRDRLVQIDLQWEGPSALISRPQVADTVGLSASQKDALRAALAARQQSRPQESPQAAERALTREALGILDSAQKDRWFAMLGKPVVLRFAAQAPPPRR